MPKVTFPVALDFIAKRYSTLPSVLMALDIVDLSFNFDVASEGAEYEQAQLDELERQRGGRPTNLDLPSKAELESFFSSLPEDSKLRMMTINAER